MSKCTAPKQGHAPGSTAEKQCPVHGQRMLKNMSNNNKIPVINLNHNNSSLRAMSNVADNFNDVDWEEFIDKENRTISDNIEIDGLSAHLISTKPNGAMHTRTYAATLDDGTNCELELYYNINLFSQNSDFKSVHPLRITLNSYPEGKPERNSIEALRKDYNSISVVNS